MNNTQNNEGQGFDNLSDAEKELLKLSSDGSDYNDGSENPDDENDTDKYLAIEQPGVSYTHDTNALRNSDNLKYTGDEEDGEWNDVGGNTRNSEAFNQDEYLLEDNIDLDEDQNQSVSGDDDDFEELNERYTN